MYITFAILVIRLFNLQIVDSEKYASEYNQQSEKLDIIQGPEVTYMMLTAIYWRTINQPIQ